MHHIVMHYGRSTRENFCKSFLKFLYLSVIGLIKGLSLFRLFLILLYTRVYWILLSSLNPSHNFIIFSFFGSFAYLFFSTLMTGKVLNVKKHTLTLSYFRIKIGFSVSRKHLNCLVGFDHAYR